MSKNGNGKELVEAEDWVANLRQPDGTLNFRAVAQKAWELLGEQAMVGKENADITVEGLELGRAKASSFLDAINGLLEVSHQVELLQAEQYKFKRTDELKIMHSLRRLCGHQAKNLEKTVKIASKRLEELMEGIDEDLVGSERADAIAQMQSVISSNIDGAAKVTSSFSRLVQLERISGGRPWSGNNRGKATNPGAVKLLSEVEERNKDGSEDIRGERGPRELTEDEIMGG